MNCLQSSSCTLFLPMPLGDSIDPELGYDPELLTRAIARALPPTYDFEIPQTISKLRKRVVGGRKGDQHR